MRRGPGFLPEPAAEHTPGFVGELRQTLVAAVGEKAEALVESQRDSQRVEAPARFDEPLVLLAAPVAHRQQHQHLESVLEDHAAE
jgi:hypothetical protein